MTPKRSDEGVTRQDYRLPEGTIFSFFGYGSTARFPEYFDRFLKSYKAAIVIVAPSGKVRTPWPNDPPDPDDTIPYIEKAKEMHKPVLYVPNTHCRIESAQCRRKTHYSPGGTVYGFRPFDLKHAKMIHAGGIFLETVGVDDIGEIIDPFIGRNLDLLQDYDAFVQCAVRELCYPRYNERMAEFLRDVDAGKVGRVYT